ncbi:YhfC family glutamic-type intramembrane protease [Clostridium sp. Marseille-Q7071]
MVSKVPASKASQLLKLKEILIQTPVSNFIISFTERIFAFGIQIGLTMIVLYAIKYRKNIYLFIAILIHALIDFPAALYQMKIINLFITRVQYFYFL